MNRFIEMIEKIILALLDKINLPLIFLILVLLGLMSFNDVKDWIGILAQFVPSLQP